MAMTSQSIVLLLLLQFARSSHAVSCRRYFISNRASLDCSSSQLSDLPVLPYGVIALNLQGNRFESLPPFPESYGGLISLRLDNCGISRIPSHTFSSLKNLLSLDLSHNNISHIVFPSIPRLRSLVLSHNSLRYLPDFSRLTSLRILDLSHNRLRIIAVNFLPASIESLLLTNNNISSLPPLAHLNRLQELELAGNPLVCDCILVPFYRWVAKLTLFEMTTLGCDYGNTNLSSAEALAGTECALTVRPWPEEKKRGSEGTAVVRHSKTAIPEEHLCCLFTGPHSLSIAWYFYGVIYEPTKSEPRDLDTLSCIMARDLGEFECRGHWGNSTVTQAFVVEAPRGTVVLHGEILLYILLSSLLMAVTVPAVMILRRICSAPPAKEYREECCCEEADCGGRRGESSSFSFSSPSPSSPPSEWDSVTPRVLLHRPPLARSESHTSITELRATII